MVREGQPAGGELDTFPKLLLDNARRLKGHPAIREKDLGIWQSWSWDKVLGEVRNFALGLQEIGVSRGDRIAIVGDNRPRLYWTFIAAQSIGAIPVPVYQDSVVEEMSYVLDHAGVTCAVVEDQEQADKLLEIAADVPAITHIIYDDPRGLKEYSEDGLHDFADVQALGRKALEKDKERERAWLNGISDGKGSDIAVFLYTSGTTGRPKGVVLTHDNVLITARLTSDLEGLDETEETLAYLPMAWVGDHVFSYGQAYACGFCVSCPESPDTMLEDLREIGPSYFFAPPRIFENILTSIMIRMEDASAMKRRLFNAFLDVARKYGEPILNGEQVSLKGRLLYGLGHLLVYAPLKNTLGFSRIRVGYTAGEAIGPEIFSFYRSLGINLKQLYGQTEASVFVTVQPNGEIRADTVGKPAPGVEVKIADNGEVLYRSPGVFREYYRNEEATRGTKTVDNWVHSGDAGFFDTTGHLHIIDRAKDVGKLNDGAMFAPKYIENKLKFFPNIKEAVAFGDGRDFCAVFINIDLLAVGSWAERNNVPYASYQELAANPDVYDMIEAHVDEVNRDLSREPNMAESQIRRFLILHKELDADDGELTRTRKVRRSFIAERYEPLIRALYDGSETAHIRTQVTFEDGRKGMLEADIRVTDMQTYETPRSMEAAE